MVTEICTSGGFVPAKAAGFGFTTMLSMRGTAAAAGAAQQLRMLEGARKIKVVGALLRHRDAHALAIDVGHAADRRARGHQITGLDLEVRRRKVDLRGALRLVADEGDVPHAALHRV